MGEEWLVDKEIDVDIEQLQDFAKHIQDELEQNFRPSFERGVKPMLTVVAPFGDGALGEARFFRSQHDQSRIAAGGMLGDVMRGLISLSTAASSIAAEYLTGDALAQATHEDVYNAFASSDGQKTHENPTTTADGAKGGDDGGKPVTDFVPQRVKDAAQAPVTDQSNGLYDETYVAKGTAGEYHIPADAQDLNNPRLDVSTSTDH